MLSKTFRIGCIIILSITSGYAQKGGLLATDKSPFVKLRNVNIGDVTWKPGFWGDKVELCKQVMIPNMRTIYMERALTNFKIAAHMQEGEFQGSWWHDGDFYKWVEALVISYADTHDKATGAQIDDIISILQKAQEKDGYINTAIQIGHGAMTAGFTNSKPFSGVERWTADQHHEMYNFGHLFTLAAVHYRVTGKTTLLDIADKAADYVYSVFKNPTPQLSALIFNPPQIMGLVELYRSTGNKKYLDMARLFVNMKGMSTDKRLEDQENLPVRKLTQAEGHAVTGLYLYAGVADVYAETGDTTLLHVIDKLWNDIVDKRMYVTGGVGSYHNNSIRAPQIVSEAFGKDYDLPNSTAYNETCANIANAMFSWRMLGLTGDEKYADVMENVFYNSMLSGISLDGKSFFYTNPLRWYGQDHPLLSQDALKRWNLPRGGICCPPNVVRTIAEIANYAYSVSPDILWVNLYGSNVVNTRLPQGDMVKFKQQTNYPWDSAVKFICQSSTPKAYSVMLRIPGWAGGASVKVNGKILPAPAQGSYYEIRRVWNNNDVVELYMPMPARLVKADPRVEADINLLAVARGPVVYCIESADVKGLQLSKLMIPDHIDLKPIYQHDLLDGVTILKGTALYNNGSADQPKQLYQTVNRPAYKKIDIQLVPYYAWNNRGIGEMSVWLPQASDGD